MSDIIKFYRTWDLYGDFSNFSLHPIKIGDTVWPTTEHYFQAMKFPDDNEYQKEICNVDAPLRAKQMGNDRSKKLRDDWESVKDDIMRVAVLAKFSQYEHLKDLLLRTGDAQIIEHTIYDPYWGDGGDGTGKNMLGIILMEVRYKLKGK